MALTDAKIRAARPGEKDVKLFDERGLYLLLKPNGARYWRMKFRIHGREAKLSFGVYPEVSLKKARELRDDARELLRKGIDPRQEMQRRSGDDFETVAREWLEQQSKPAKNAQRAPLSAVTIEKAKWMLEEYIFPHIGKMPIATIEAPELLHALKKIEDKGLHETTHRSKWRCGQIFRYAIATGRAKHDITADLRGALAPVVPRNHPALTDPGAVAGLLRAIDTYEGQPSTQYVLKILPYVFLRSSEIRLAEWPEIDWQDELWRVPGPRMKMDDPHLVPLPRQVIKLLEELQAITGRGALIFPGLRPGRPLSENTINAALRTLGYSKDEMTGHGFRTIADTLLNEQGFAPDVIELQLAHKERNKVRAAYNKAQRLKDRREMMQAWADYLDTLRDAKNVVSMKRRKA